MKDQGFTDEFPENLDLENPELEKYLEDPYIESCLGEYGIYTLYKPKKDEIEEFCKSEEYVQKVAEWLGIEKKSVWDIVDTEIVYIIYRCFNIKVEGERYYAKVGKKWKIILSDDFGEPELSKNIDGPFDSAKDLLMAFEYFIQSIEDYDPDFDSDQYRESGSEYADSYAHDVEGLTDDYIDNVFGGDPEAYWNID